jgi:hypothetical protein
MVFERADGWACHFPVNNSRVAWDSLHSIKPKEMKCLWSSSNIVVLDLTHSSIRMKSNDNYK